MTLPLDNIIATFALELSAAIDERVGDVVGRSGASASAVSYLRQEPGVGITALRVALGISQPATVRLVNQLAEEGFLHRVGHHHDGRRVQLSLTESGERLADEVLAARSIATRTLLGSLNSTEYTQLGALLAAVLSRRSLDHGTGEHLCRLCDVASCSTVPCPVEAAVLQR